MTTAIEFNRKIKLIAKEIKNISTYWDLPPKFETAKISVPQ